jgi:hypothetical protein
MKKWLYFAGLKILELCALVLACYVSHIIGSLLCSLVEHAVPWYLCTLMGIAVCIGAIYGILVISCLIITVIPAIIRKNIEWANKLSGQPK